jgi:hypothetical protein
LATVFRLAQYGLPQLLHGFIVEVHACIKLLLDALDAPHKPIQQLVIA